MDGRDHAVHLQTLAPGHIERAVGENLHLEPLEDPMLFTVPPIPLLDPAALQPEPFTIETRGHLEAPRVVGHHRPRKAPPVTGAGHRLEGGLAVRIPGVPMRGSAKLLRGELRRTVAQGFGYGRARKVAGACGAPSWVLSRRKPIHCGGQRVFTVTGRKLLDKGPQPGRSAVQRGTAGA